ncbi:extracellular solute-binding protein family 1 [Thermoanaerobacterium thermosaccharolyticum DSM 571]|uniref:Extracellular solute-binding protein family 1 n=1 Tax=Thermoanaerobacterium thermosaccharolyticum (strain ATCC 7956 / DSM 571 / NCIMB 9385 / NCA 3814 / NCTC 13789 / WDCM 00135 / 2032) TaxID=580327 RepID=D9TN01_THETC|nr:extracellular solute-binding protein [Thermoanaerobacterium thermosaccharolyticum]ADL68524.1 extracellular solute-binding protein family 1 [Thermoanaerobacterium thermosaccharolyticum DSM 571]
MKLFKKIMLIFLSIMLIVSTSACGTGSNNSSNSNASKSSKSSGTNEKITLTFWNIFTSDPQKTIVKNIVDKWNQENPNVQIEQSITENDAYKTKIKTAIAANEAPDIIYAWGGGFSKPFVDAGKILSLDDYLNDGTKDKMLPGALNNITYNGKVYGLTFAQQASVLYVNKELFDKYSVKIPTTFSELVDAIKTFKANGITPFALGEKDEWPGMWYYDMIALREAGAQLSRDALNGKASFEDQAFINAAEKLQEMVNAGAFDQGVMGLTRDEATAEFNQGKAAMYFGGNFDAASFEVDSSLVKGKVEAVRFPTIEGGKGDPTEYIGGGSDVLLVNANTKYKDEAVKAAKYLAENMSLEFYKVGAALPTWKYDSVDQSKVDPLEIQIMNNIVANSKDSVLAWDLYLEGDQAQTHKDLVAQLFAKQITPQDYAKQMQEKINGK